MSLVFNVAAHAAPTAAPSPIPTREDMYILIKEELMLTVEIYKTQVEILSMMVSIHQLSLESQNDEFSNQIEEFRRLKQYEGKFNAERFALLQEQLNKAREDLSGVNLILQQHVLKVKQAEVKIQENFDNINKLAQQFIKEVESNKKPDLPPAILKTMKESFTGMSKAIVATGLDKKATDLFMRAVDDYVKFESSYDENQGDILQNQMLMLQSYSSAESAHSQYADMETYLNGLRKMLDAETARKNELQRRLDELKKMPMGKTYEDKIYFASGSVTLSLEAIRILNKFAASVPSDDDYEIMITGFADTTPIGAKLKHKYASNWELSLARSSAVVNYMLEKLKFPPEKIIIAGKGQYAPNQDTDAKDLSRRVEFRFVPKSK